MFALILLLILIFNFLLEMQIIGFFVKENQNVISLN